MAAILSLVFYYVFFLSPAYASDLSAPSLTSPSDGAVVNGAAYTQTWSAVPSAIRYEYQSYHDAAGLFRRWIVSQSETSKPVAAVANATYWWRVRAINADGQVSGWSPLWKLTVDNDKPTIHSPSFTRQLSSADISVMGAIIEPNLDKITMKVDDVALDSSAIEVTGASYTASLQNIAIGNHTLTIAAVDKAGNSTTASYAFAVTDNTPPQIAVTSPVQFNEGNNVVISGTAMDGHSVVANVSVAIDGNDRGSVGVVDGIFSYHAGALPVGTHTVTVRGSDAAGNQGVSQPVTITVRDVTPPHITLGEGRVITEGDVATVAGTVDDSSIREVAIYVGDAERGTVPVVDGMFSYSLADLTVGTYAVEVRATDSAGNRGVANIQVRVEAVPLPTPEPTTEPQPTPQPKPSSPSAQPAQPTPASPTRQPAQPVSKQQPTSTASNTTHEPPAADVATHEQDNIVAAPNTIEPGDVDGGTTDAAQEIKGSTTDRSHNWGLTLWSWVIPLVIGVIGGWYLSTVRHRRRGK